MKEGAGLKPRLYKWIKPGCKAARVHETDENERRYVNRQQMSWRAVDVERLIDEDHAARAIWTLLGRLDLSSFYRGIESSAEEGGRPVLDSTGKHMMESILETKAATILWFYPLSAVQLMLTEIGPRLSGKMIACICWNDLL